MSSQGRIYYGLWWRSSRPRMGSSEQWLNWRNSYWHGKAPADHRIVRPPTNGQQCPDPQSTRPRPSNIDSNTRAGTSSGGAQKPHANKRRPWTTMMGGQHSAPRSRITATPRAFLPHVVNHGLGQGPRRMIRHWPQILTGSRCQDRAGVAESAFPHPQRGPPRRRPPG